MVTEPGALEVPDPAGRMQTPREELLNALSQALG